MAPAWWRHTGMFLAALLLLAGCMDGADKTRTGESGKSDLAQSLLDAAVAAQAQNDPTSAAAYYRSALAREPGNIKAEIGLMQCLRMTGGLDEARSVAAKVMMAKPDDPAVLAEAGKVKLATGQLQEAIRLLKEAVAANAQDWKSHSALGLAYDRLGDYAQADRNYDAALAVAPDDAGVLNNYALSHAMAGDLVRARDLLVRAVAANGADLRVRQNLALVYALSGDIKEAEELTRHDLPPALASETLDYYRRLATAVAPPRP